MNGGDHKGVTLFAHSPMDPPSENTVRQPHIRHWKPRHFRTFTHHMRQWARRNPPRGCIMERQRGILIEVGRYVSEHQPPPPEADVIEANLRQAVTQKPSERSRRDLINHLSSVSSARANKELRRFRKAAVQGRKQFFSDVRTWLTSPFRAVNPQPDTSSAAEHLPKFAGDPEFNDEETRKLLDSVLPQQEGFRVDTPSWEAFQRASPQPVKKSSGVDCVPHTSYITSRRRYSGICT